MSLDIQSTNSGLHGTTAIACTYKEGGMLAVECRTSNEKMPIKRLKIEDDVQKFYNITSHIKGVMLGDRNASVTMADELMKKCADMKSVLSVFEAAEAYVSDFKGKQMQFGTIICGYDAKGFHILGVYVNGNEVGKITDMKFLSLGTGSIYVKKMAEKLMSMRTEAQCNELSLDLDEAVDFMLKCLFDATFRDYRSGGPLCVYIVSNGMWKRIRTLDVLDAYETYYDSYDQENILFLLVNCAKGEDLLTKELLAYFGQYGGISLAHRVARIGVYEKAGFYFHRLVCNTPEDASQIFSHVMEAGTYTVDAKAGHAVKEILKAFPHRVSIDTRSQSMVPLYVNRASKNLLNLLRSSCNFKTHSSSKRKRYPTIDITGES